MSSDRPSSERGKGRPSNASKPPVYAPSNTVKVPLRNRQEEILKDWTLSGKNYITVIPVGSGKSLLARKMIQIAMIDPNLHCNKDIVFSASTFAQAKETLWDWLVPEIEQDFPEDFYQINHSNNTIRFRNVYHSVDKTQPEHLYFRLKTAQQGLTWRGLNVGLWIADEAALYEERELTEIQTRLRPSQDGKKKQGKAIYISTPNGDGPFKTLFDRAKLNPKKWGVHHFPYQVLNESQEMIDWRMEEKNMISKLDFESNHECSFESVTDKFFYEWKKDFIGDVDDISAYTLASDIESDSFYSFHDFNKANMCVLLAKVDKDNRKIEIFKEYAIKDCSTEGMCQRIREDYPDNVIRAIIDASGTQVNRDTTSPFGATDARIMKLYKFNIVNRNRANPLISDTDNSSNIFIRDGNLTVDRNCGLTLQALNSYHYDSPSRKGAGLVKYSDPKYSHIDGLGDCLRYGIHHLFPPSLNIDKTNRFTEYATRPGWKYTREPAMWPGGPTYSQIFRESYDTYKRDAAKHKQHLQANRTSS